MPWVLGIDEAGYGPNLGPLVQASVAMQLPDDDIAGWMTLHDRIRKVGEPEDDRILVDDSKKVYTGPNGFEKLERSILSLASAPFVHTATVRVVSPVDFNREVDASGSKATVLARGLIELLQVADAILPHGECMVAMCDKQGGRAFYGAMLQEAFPDSWIVTLKEGAAESRYRIAAHSREIEVAFRPRADGDSACVAIASMICKSTRELSMAQFNAWWAKHVPGIAPTAGYPVDAKRFFAQIQAKMQELRIPLDTVWRKK